MRKLLAVLAGSLIACGSAATRPSAPAATPSLRAPIPSAESPVVLSTGRLVIVPMAVVARSPSNETRELLLLREDGTILANGKVVARILTDSVISAEGEPIIRVEASGALAITGAKGAKPQFLPNDDLATGRSKLRIGDDGVPVLLREGDAPDTFPGYIRGFAPNAKRTAILLMILVTLPGDEPEPREPLKRR